MFSKIIQHSQLEVNPIWTLLFCELIPGTILGEVRAAHTGTEFAT